MVWRFARAHPGPLALAVSGATVYAFGVVGGTIVVGRVVDRVVVPALTEERPATATIWGAVAALIGVALVRSVGIVGRRYFGSMAMDRNKMTLRLALGEHYLGAPVSFHRERPTGELLAHVDTDVEMAGEAIAPLPLSLGVVTLTVVAMASLVAVDPLIALIGVALFPGLVVLNHVVGRRLEAPAADAQQHIGTVATVAHESFEGALVVKTLGREADEVARLSAAAGDLLAARLRLGRVRSGFEPTVDVLPNLGAVALVLVGAWRVSQGAMTTGELVQAATLFSLLGFPMRVMGFFLEQLPRSIVALERVDAVLAEAPPPACRNAPEGTDAGPGGGLPWGPLGLTVDGLRFAYDGNEVLADVSFELAPGEAVALVGQTGSGKTTLCEVVVGLVAPAAGRVQIGGHELGGIAATELADRVALVFQEPFLFAEEALANVTLGRDLDDATVADALRTARASRFVDSLPRGGRTIVGERGVTLSGGQRQRLALARALARQPGLLVLDDATSAVDPVIEAEILDGLRRERRSTLLIVAHRLSTIALADRVLFLDAGRLVATGRHDELLALPAYAALARAYESAEAPRAVSLRRHERSEPRLRTEGDR
jgi:ABC-type multidrug transport system fused ATPase/permease subunit